MELSNSQLSQRKEELEALKGQFDNDSQQLSAAKHGLTKVRWASASSR